MATFVARGFTTTTNNLTPHSTYIIARGQGIRIPDGVYRPGDVIPITVNTAGTTIPGIFVGYVAGTNYPIFDRSGAIQFDILFTSDPGGNSYDPGTAANIIEEPLGIGGPVVFADFGLRGSGTNLYASQGMEIEFDRAVYDVNDAATLRIIMSRDADGSPNYGATITTTFNGLDPETGNPIFTPTGGSSSYNGGRHIVAASVRDTAGYTIPTNSIVAEAWPPEVAFQNYGVRQGADIDNDEDFDLQGTSAGFVGLDIPAGVYRPGDTLTIRAFGGVGDGESVEVKYLGYHNRSGYRNPLFETDDFNGQRTQFIGTRELNTADTYDPQGPPVTFEGFGAGVATFADYAARIPETTSGGNTNNLNSQDREVDLDYEDLAPGNTATLRLYRVSGGARTFDREIRAQYAGFDRETGDPLFNPEGGGRQLLLASEKVSSGIVYTVPHGPDVDDGDGTVEDRTGGDIIAGDWPPAATDATYTNYGFRQGDLTAAFDLQGAGVSFGLHVPPGIYRKGDTLTIQAYRGTASGSRTVEFVGYVADDSGTNYPIFETADFNGQRAQFIGTNEAHATDTYTAGTIVDNMPLGIGDATFGAWAINDDPNNSTEFDVTNGVAKFPYGIYDSQNNAVMYQLNDGTPVSATYVGHERGSGFPVFQFQNQAGVNQLIMMLSETTEDKFNAEDILIQAWPAASLDPTYSNFGFRQAANLQDLANMEFDLRGAGIDVPDNVYTPNTESANEVDVRFFGGGYAGLSEELTYIGYIEDPGGELYPVFQADDFQGNGPAQFIGTGEPATTDTYAAGTIVTDTPLELGDVRFDNLAIRQGTGIEGTYQFLGAARDIPPGSYMVGDTTKGGATLMIPDQDGAPQAVRFAGYQTSTNYPIFTSINPVNGEFINYLLTDEPSTATTVTLTAADITTTGAYTTCFAPGTLIATPDGERAVETLKPGDAVLTADGDTVPVKWLGFQKVSTLFGPREQTLPVRIRAGALGRNTPHTDLVVTRDHGMILDGVVCNAGALINGTSIVEVPARELNADPKGVVTYYHVETEGHVPLLANGAVAESFIDNVGRETFSNHVEFVAMYGADVPPMTEMETPRAMSMRQVPLRIRQRLARRADILLAPPAAPSGIRRLWGACFRGLRDRVRLAGRLLGIA